MFFLAGPLISAAQYQRVLGYIEGAKREGASVLCGGGRPADAPPKVTHIHVCDIIHSSSS